MADFDWGSLATNILPAAVGALVGARNGGMGAIPGALYGFNSGIRQGMDYDLQREEINRKIAQQNAQNEQAQQRIELEKQSRELQSRNYNRLDKIADEQIKNYSLERQKMQMEIDAATRTTTGQAGFRALLTPENQAAFDAAPNKQGFIEQYYKDKDWQAKTQSAAPVLKTMGLDEKTAQMLGPTGTAHLLGSIMESRNKPSDRFGFHYDSESGMGFSYNKENGQVTTTKIGEPKVSNEKRTVIEKSMLDLWKARNGPLAKLAEDSGDWSAYDEWRASPLGRIEASYRTGGITFDQAQGYRESFARQEQQDSAQALQGMRQTAPNMSEADFQQYLQTPKGQQNLNAWKQYVKMQGRQPTQTSVGAVQFDPSVSPEERAAIKAKLGAPAAAPAAKTGKKRPSLDEIFGK
jgi:hypothetical protein